MLLRLCVVVAAGGSGLLGEYSYKQKWYPERYAILVGCRWRTAHIIKKVVMKKFVLPLLCSTLGSLAGGYFSSSSSGSDMNWAMSLVFGLLFGLGFIIWKQKRSV